jgi:hypothetical protein
MKNLHGNLCSRGGVHHISNLREGAAGGIIKSRRRGVVGGRLVGVATGTKNLHGNFCAEGGVYHIRYLKGDKGERKMGGA